MSMDKDQGQKMLAYIDALEKANEQLVFALKKCVELLVQIQPNDADQKLWKGMLEDLQGIIRVGERIIGSKSEI